MAGKPNRSGPPGNTNASKYGWRSVARRGLVRPKDAWVNRLLDRYIEALLADKPACTAGEQHAAEVAGMAKACSLLILNELKQSGFTSTIDGVLELTPAARELPRFLGVELSALKLLGLERRAKPTTSLPEYLETFASGESAPAASEPPAPEDAR